MTFRTKILAVAIALSIATTAASFGVRAYADSEYRHELDRMGHQAIVSVDRPAAPVQDATTS